MNFDLSSEDLRWLERVAAVAAELPATDRVDDADLFTARAATREILARLAAVGYLSRGFDNPAAEQTVVDMAAMETLAAGARSAMLTAAMSTRVLGRAIAAWGTPEQQARWLQPLIAGRALGALALSEASLNVDNDPLQTTADPDADHIRLNGKKSFVVNAPLADVFGVIGMHADRPALFLVAPDAAGLRIMPRVRAMGHADLWIAGLELKGTPVAAEDLVQPPPDIDLLDQLRLWENEVLMAQALGLMKAAYESARDYAKSHRSGGKPIIAYQEVGFKLSEMLTLYQTAQLFAYRAVWTAAVDPRAGRSLNWCAKVFCTESAERVAGDALRILGQAGCQTGSPAAGAYRAVKLTQIGGTSTEIARVKIGDVALGF
jgi:alkylation response protein AidB-like acyl-CoA dehydrogenase